MNALAHMLLFAFAQIALCVRLSHRNKNINVQADLDMVQNLTARTNKTQPFG